MSFVALRPLNIQKPDGTMEVRSPGQSVPEAGGWPNLQSWLNRGWIALAEGAVMPLVRPDFTPNRAVDPDGRPIADIEKYKAERDARQMTRKQVLAAATHYGLAPASFESDAALRTAIGEARLAEVRARGAHPSMAPAGVVSTALLSVQSLARLTKAQLIQVAVSIGVATGDNQKKEEISAAILQAQGGASV